MKKLNRRSFLKWTGLAGASSLLGFPSVIHTQPKEIEIGTVFALTGSFSHWGVMNFSGYQFVFDEVNAAGGIKSLGGAKIKMTIKDGQCKSDVSQALLKKTLYENPLMIVEGNGSQDSIIFSPIAEKERMIHIQPMGLADGITRPGWKYTFMMNAKVGALCGVAFDFVKDIGKKTGQIPKKVAIMGEDSEFGQSGAKAYKELVEKSDMELVDYFIYPSAQGDFSAIISKYKALKVDVVFQAAYIRDSILILQTAEMLKFNPIAMIGSAGGGDTQEFLDKLGRTANYYFNVSIFPLDLAENPLIKPLNERYKKRFGKDLFQVSALGATGAGVIVDALERAGTTDREAVREALMKTDLPLGKSYCVNPERVKFNEIGSNIGIKGLVTQVFDEKRLTVWPEKYAVKKPVWPWPKWEER